MPEKFILTPNREGGEKFAGYFNKHDQTALPPGRLVSGSQNVISTDADTIAVRRGYTLDGAASTALTPILSSYEFVTNRNEERPLRFYNGNLEFRYTDGVWKTLRTGLSATANLNFCEFWSTTETELFVLFVDGTSNIYEWNGATTTFLSATAATITKQGSGTWAASGFLTAGTRTLRVLTGTTYTEYTYTGGETTTTLTGVSPDPTTAGHAAGDLIFQATRLTANSGITTLPDDFANALIANLNNQLYVGSLTDVRVFVSRTNSLTDFSNSATRLPGEGASLFLDAQPVAFVPQEDDMYISAGEDFWYRTLFTRSADTASESLIIKRLKSGAKGAAKSQATVGRIKNEIVFISEEPTLDTLGRIEDVQTPTTKPLSDNIKTDFDDYDFANAHVLYHKNNIYIAVPAESLLLIYNISKGYWEAPQILPIRRLAIIGGNIYGHSSAVPETYRLFNGTNDNSGSIAAKIVFSYQNYGNRTQPKSFFDFYTEGYIAGNTTLTLKLKYDYDGSEQIIEKTIDGNDDSILFQTLSDDSLGNNTLGEVSLGGDAVGSSAVESLPKFRIINTIPRTDFYEIQVSYETDAIDYRWSILAFGPAVKLSNNKAIEITQ